MNDVQRGVYPCKQGDAIKLAAIHYYVWHGPYDETMPQFSLPYMRGYRIGDQLMPTPWVTAQVCARARKPYARNTHRKIPFSTSPEPHLEP